MTLGAVAETLADAHHCEWASVLAAMVRIADDLDVATAVRRSEPADEPASV